MNRSTVPTDRRDTPMRPINQFLPAELLSKAAELDAVTQTLRKALPEAMASHVWFAGTRADAAVLITDSSSWLTPLRFEQAAILDCLSRSCQLHCLRVTVKVSLTAHATSEPHPRAG